MSMLPVEARDVVLRWIIGGVFYVFDFTIAEGEPVADFDFPIPGARGGTHRTRYYGNLEGVSLEVKDMVKKAQIKSGQSMYSWLNDALSKIASGQLDD